MPSIVVLREDQMQDSGSDGGVVVVERQPWSLAPTSTSFGAESDSDVMRQSIANPILDCAAANPDDTAIRLAWHHLATLYSSKPTVAQTQRCLRRATSFASHVVGFASVSGFRQLCIRSAHECSRRVCVLRAG